MAAMKAHAIPLLAAAIAVLAAGTAAAGGGHAPRIQQFQNPGSGPDTRYSGNPGAPYRQTTPPAGMPNFYQPPNSIDNKEWWLPNPYFQSNGQGFGYPTRPVARPYAGYWKENR